MARPDSRDVGAGIAGVVVEPHGRSPPHPAAPLDRPAVHRCVLLSIDGEVYPFQWSDLIAALLIFGLITMLYRLSVAEQSTDDGDL